MSLATKKSFISEENEPIQATESHVLKFHNIENAINGTGSLHEAIAEVYSILHELSKAVEKSNIKLVPDEKRVATKNITSTTSTLDSFFELEDKAPTTLKRKKYKSETYFNVKNHSELFDLGRHYLKQTQTGKKMFSFYGESDKHSLTHSLVGLSAFFNYHENKKVTLIIDKFNQSEYEKLLTVSHVESYKIKDFELEFKVAGGVEILEINQLKHLFCKVDNETFVSILHELKTNSDIILTEFSSLEEIEKEKEFYFGLNGILDSVTLLAKKGLSRSSDLKKIISFNKKYNIKVEGVVFS